MKLYIAVLDEVPDRIVPTLVAHSVLNAHVKFFESEDYKDWFYNSFKKVVLRVSLKEFEKIRGLPEVWLGHENKTLGGAPSCVVVQPRKENPNVLTFAKLWEPKYERV